MERKINVGILFGGKSAEHEVSLRSAKNVFDAIDRDKYNPILIGIDKSGKWLLNACDPERFALNGAAAVPAAVPAALLPQSEGRLLNLTNPQEERIIDVAFPILHGPFGEDGTVQGLLKLADIPFVGAGVLGSAVGMDKDVMKRLLRDGGVPIGAFLVLKSHEALPAFGAVVERLGLPFFVKPANMGSSVGVSKIHGEAEYRKALEAAFAYDRKIVLEEFIKGRELECSVLGNEEPAASVPGEVIASHEFYSYEAKYLDEQGAVLEIPAKIAGEVVREIQELAVKTFRVLECEGLGRVDFFLREDGRVLVNEINTMPGFTNISMYPKLWEAGGVSYTAVIDKLIELAIRRHRQERALKTGYERGLL
ncbi:MAG: D-alanine--D-alanine ligase [Treponema sp.]|jgi:D-alanine-D-alanine ligase|nr:D-alanine--D-alanine ligase [Treponema sp.]